MKSDEALWNLCIKTYNKLYKLATPSADFDELMRKGITAKPNWFMKYYLDQKIQDKIIKAAIKKHKLDKYDEKRFRFEMYLGSSPRGVK